MLRRVLTAIAAAVAITMLSGAPAAVAGGPSITVGPIHLDGNPGCC